MLAFAGRSCASLSASLRGGTSLHRTHRKIAAAAGVAAASALAFAGFAPATQAATPPGPVLAAPVTSIPHFPATTSTTEQIRQIAQCGNTMYAVGSFSVVKRQSTTYTRNNVFSFSATAPYAVTSWAPAVNGTVNSITFNGGNCANAYIGGKFTAIGSTTVKNIAEIDTTTGNVVTAFGHSASGQIETLASYQNHILAGGYFTGDQRQHSRPVHGEPEPHHGQERRLRPPVYLRELSVPRRRHQHHEHLQPGAQPRRHPGPGDG